MTAPNPTLIFTYGTLKHGHPNHNLIQNLINQNDADFMGPYVTCLPYPLVLGPQGIPYLINLPGSGHRVKGELYALSAEGLARLDELEGTGIGHYERLPLQIEAEGETGNDAVLVDAEAYFAHRRFGERLWEKRGKEGMSDYGEREAREYVRIEDRLKGGSVVADMEVFLSSSNC